MLVLKDKASVVFFLVLFVGILLGGCAAWTYEYSTDQLQLFIRGNYLAKYGIWVHFGNPSSGGMGNVPGSLTTVLFGVPLKVWYSAYSPLIIIALSHLFSFLLIDQILKAEFSTRERIIFAVIYWLNPWRVMLTGPWNPAFLLFCTALHFWSSYRLKNQPDAWASLIHVLSIGLAFQLHNSSVVLAITSLLLVITKTIYLRWRWVIFGVILILLSLVPAILALVDQQQIKPGIADEDAFLGRGLIYVFPLIKGILYWFRYSSLYLAREIFQHLGFDWIGVVWIKLLIEYIWLIAKWLLGILSVIFSVWVGLRAFREIKPIIWSREFANLNMRSWMLIYVFFMFAAVFAASCLTPITFNHWHLILVLPICLLPLYFYLVDCLSKQQARTQTALTLLAGYFIVVGGLASIQSGDHNYRLNPQAQFQSWLDKNMLTPDRNRN